MRIGGFDIDTTKQKRAELALRETRQRSRAGADAGGAEFERPRITRVGRDRVAEPRKPAIEPRPERSTALK